MFRIAVLLALATITFTQPSLACTEAAGGSQGVSAINDVRSNAGRAGLAVHAALTAQAQAFACDMAARGYFSHVTPEGRSFQARLKAAGLPGGCGAENIAYTSSSGNVGGALSQWVGSGSHKRNMLGRYRVAGLAGAVGSGKTYWVLIVGACG
jgi:uncharacterized protein YkwD